jgi:formylglycine-generating enzyme required for sulfatase activity
MTDCGSEKESCCTRLYVTAGTYHRLYKNFGSGPTSEIGPTMLSGFHLDKYDVTVGRFRQFVAAWKGGFTPPPGSGKHWHLNGLRGLSSGQVPSAHETGWLASDNGNIAPTDTHLSCGSFSTWTSAGANNELLPINCVNWYEAYAFCIWDGGFLPSEAESGYAAAGGSKELRYPWGASQPGTGNQYAIYNCNYPSGSGACASVSNVAPVGTAILGVGLWGQLDLAGNVRQWNLDDFVNYDAACLDCAFFDSPPGATRVWAGAAFFDDSSRLAPSTLGTSNASYRDGLIGMRCARLP